MLPDQFRKRILASQTGLAFYYAIAFFIGMSFAFGFHLYSVIINAGASSFFGLMMASKFHKENKYLVNNIKEDKFSRTRKFLKMLKNGEIPKTKSEKDEYLEFLLATEQTKIRLAKPNQIWFLAFLILMFIGYVIDFGFDIWAAIFVVAVLLVTRTPIKAKSDLKKIEILKEKLAHSS